LHHIAATTFPLKYHSTEARRLLEVTSAGLSGNGIEILGLGERLGSKIVLRGGLVLTPHAAAQMPPSMYVTYPDGEMVS
jgi:hypothetical protein